MINNIKTGGNMKKFAVVLLIVLMPLVASAGEVELGGVGNDDIYLLHGSINERVAPFDVSLTHRYGKNGGEPTTNVSTAGLHFNEPVSWRWTLWADEVASNDRIVGLKENILGAGATYTAHMTGVSSLKLSAGPMHHYSAYNNGRNEGQLRASFRLKWKYEIEDALASFTAFYRPEIGETQDYLTTTIAALEFGNFKASVEDHYRSIVSDGQKHRKTYWLLTWTATWGEK
jgi:hypothetical protein